MSVDMLRVLGVAVRQRGLRADERFERAPARLVVASFDNAAGLTVRCMPGLDRPDEPWFLLVQPDQTPEWIGQAGDIAHAIQVIENALLVQRTCKVLRGFVDPESTPTIRIRGKSSPKAA